MIAKICDSAISCCEVSFTLSINCDNLSCECSISLPDAGVHVSIQISRLYLRVYVLCTYRRKDLRPLVWNVAVCTCVLFE